MKNAWRVSSLTFIIQMNSDNLFCGKHGTTMQIRIVSRLSDFAGDLEDSKSTSGGIRCIFGSHTLVPISWMCFLADFSFTQLNRSWSYFSRCIFTHGWDSRSRSLGLSDWSISFLTEPKQQNQRCKRATEKLVGKILNHTSENKFQPRTPISIWPILITFHQAEHILVPLLCCMSLRIMKPWSRW